MKFMSKAAFVTFTIVLLCISYAPASLAKEEGNDVQRQKVYDALCYAITAAEYASHGIVHLYKEPKFQTNEVESLQTCATLVDQSGEQLNEAIDESNRLFCGDGDDQIRKDDIGLATSTASIVYRTCMTNLRDVKARQVVTQKADQLMMPFVHSALTAMNVVKNIKV